MGIEDNYFSIFDDLLLEDLIENSSKLNESLLASNEKARTFRIGKKSHPRSNTKSRIYKK